MKNDLDKNVLQGRSCGQVLLSILTCLHLSPLDCTWDTWGIFTGKGTKTVWAKARQSLSAWVWLGTITVTPIVLIVLTVMDTASGNQSLQMEYKELGLFT